MTVSFRIQVLFSIADLDAPSENSGMRPAEEDVDAEEAEAESEEPSFPVRTAITISKGPGQGGLTVDAVAEDGLFVIDAVSFYKDEQQALDMSAEGDWKRRALYMGPEVRSFTFSSFSIKGSRSCATQFEALDEGLQEQFEAFLEVSGSAFQRLACCSSSHAASGTRHQLEPCSLHPRPR